MSNDNQLVPQSCFEYPGFQANPDKTHSEQFDILIELSLSNHSESMLNIILANNILKKMIHEQVPLPVPCYDLAPLTESSLGPLARNFGYPQLAWLDGR